MPAKDAPGNRSRKAAYIKPSLDVSLRSYATAAFAAGIGVLSFTHPAQARIVFTSKHETLFPGQSLNIDLNGDGVNDFAIGDHRVAIGTLPSYGSLLADAAPLSQTGFYWGAFWALAPLRKPSRRA